MTQARKLRLEFFHDAVCGWCFNLSPRLRTLAQEFDLDIRHRTCVLQDSPSRMIEVFGSMAAAKATILGHWAACADASDTPEKFAIDRMRAARFDYPSGLPSALACQVAQKLAGPHGHWRMFDALQDAHISRALNIADVDVLVDVAAGIGFDPDRFRQDLQDPRMHSAVAADRELASRLRVRVVPTVIVPQTGVRLRNGRLLDLREQLHGQLSALSGLPSTALPRELES